MCQWVVARVPDTELIPYRNTIVGGQGSANGVEENNGEEKANHMLVKREF